MMSLADQSRRELEEALLTARRVEQLSRQLSEEAEALAKDLGIYVERDKNAGGKS